MHIDWKDLQAVEALVRTGTLAGAASELGLRHTTVSRRIDRLEDAIGTPVLLRGARLRPTAVGRSIAEKVDGMRHNVAEIEDLLLTLRRSREQRLVITTSDILLPLLMRAIAAAELEQRVAVHVSDAEEHLDPGRIDFALRPSQEPAGSLRGSRLGRARLGVFRAVHDRRARCPWIAPSPELRSRHSLRWLKVIPRDADVGIECGSLPAMRDACIAGLGRAPLPAFVAAEDRRLRQEKRLESGPPLWLLSPASRRSDRALQAARRELITALRSIKIAWA
ncbi:MAG: LysR family transcriptional regulator [Myxococcota bacterium]